MEAVPRPRISDILTGLAVTAAYMVAGKIGLSLAFVNASATAVWPPTGIALGAFLVLGYRIWPGLLLGAFLVNVTTTGDVATSIGIAVGNTLEGLLGCHLVRRFAGGRHVFDHATTIFKFAVLAGLVSTAVSATIGVTTLSLGGFAPWSEFGAILLTWWLGDGAGALVVTPLVVLWWLNPRVSWNRREWGEFAILLVLLVVLALLVFSGLSPFHSKHYPVQYLCLPALVWTAFRFGQRESATASALLSGIAIHGTLQGFGPFAGRPVNESLLLLQGFLAVVSIMVIATAAVVIGRRRVEQSVRVLNEELERRVAERTEQLWLSNEELRNQIQKRARERKELERSEARLREAQRAARMGSWEWDIEKDTIWWSQELYSIYGLERASTLAGYEAYLARIHPDDRANADHVVSTALRDKQPFSFEHRIVRPDGTIRIVLGQGDVVADRQGRAVRIMGTSQDITEHKTAENERAALAREQEARRQAEEANRLKDEFLATLSHELRTPLNAIVGWANLLKDGRLDPATTTRAVETINRNVKIQSHLISDILDISRMTSGQVELKMQPVHLAAVIEGALDTMRPTARAKNVSLERALEPIPRPVLGDPDRLSQIVWNLVSNAIKFAPEGGRVVVRLDQEDSAARIRVEDDGPGIDPEFLPHVFERFRQKDSSRTRRYGGLGLGLAIVRRLVELHGGGVSASNRESGKGAVFTVSLPMTEVLPLRGAGSPDLSAEPAKAGTAETGPDPGGRAGLPLRGARILLVEDDQDSRELIAMFLSRCGAEVAAVGSSSEAFTSLASRRPDVVVSDIAMPGESGYDLIEKLRSLPVKDGGSLPAIALTAYAGAEDVSRALRAGFDAHMAKPVEMRDLVRMLRDLIDGHRGAPG
ncbi:MAG TPA: MASE1 domain-containing protein [Candidatus Eisenbacteria bacterium]